MVATAPFDRPPLGAMCWCTNQLVRVGAVCPCGKVDKVAQVMMSAQRRSG
jgi:hypothetical protein